MTFWLSLGPPTPPKNLKVKEVNKDYVVLNWEPPEYDGGEKIPGYEVEKALAGGMFVPAGYSDETEFKVTKLYEGNEYQFLVKAENKIGMSQAASLEKAVKAKLPYGNKVYLIALWYSLILWLLVERFLWARVRPCNDVIEWSQ